MKTVIDVLKQSDFSSGLIETKKKKAGNLFPAFFIYKLTKLYKEFFENLKKYSLHHLNHLKSV